MKIRKLTRTAALAVVLIAAGQLPAWAQAEGVFFRVQLSGTNYCHLKFPAIREETLNWERPVLHNASQTGAVINFYGPCDYDPRGKEAVRSQKMISQRMRSMEYNN